MVRIPQIFLPRYRSLGWCVVRYCECETLCSPIHPIEPIISLSTHDTYCSSYTASTNIPQISLSVSLCLSFVHSLYPAVYLLLFHTTSSEQKASHLQPLPLNPPTLSL